MTIFHIHTWGWPRRRGDRDVQVCTKCGAERDSEIQFAVSGPTNSAGKRQPRYRRWDCYVWRD